MELETNYVEFSDPRLVAIYDVLNPFGEDSEFFCEQVRKLSPTSVIDLGCGTGILTCELARRGFQMMGVDPSSAMLAAARKKPKSEEIGWVEGSFEQLHGRQADMILMTSHVAQFFLEDHDWRAMLRAAHEAISENGHLIFDVRRLSNPPFTGWPTENSRKKVKLGTEPDAKIHADLGSANEVEWWFKFLSLDGSRLRYELHYLFSDCEEEIVSINELAFRSQSQVELALHEAGFEVKNIYGDWDSSLVRSYSPEMIFIAKRFS